MIYTCWGVGNRRTTKNTQADKRWKSSGRSVIREGDRWPASTGRLQLCIYTRPLAGGRYLAQRTGWSECRRDWTRRHAVTVSHDPLNLFKANCLAESTKPREGPGPSCVVQGCETWAERQRAEGVDSACTKPHGDRYLERPRVSEHAV